MLKFRVAPVGVAFRCLGHCIRNWSPTSAESGCFILDGAGSFLWRLPYARPKLETIMEAFRKLRAKLPQGSADMVTHTLSQVVPKER